MLHLAVTGGIATGKSVVCKILEIFGAHVYYSDSRARELMESDSAMKKALIDYFGAALFIDGKMNKQLLRERIFNSSTDRVFVDSVVHPAVLSDYFKWRENCQARFSVIETALLPSLNISSEFDEIWAVTAPDNIRLQRIMERDKQSRDQALLTLSAQPEQSVYANMANRIIINDEINFVTPQIIDFLALLNY